MEPWAERSEVTHLSRPGKLDFKGTSASLSQISCRKSLIPKGRSKLVGNLDLEMTDNYAHSTPIQTHLFTGGAAYVPRCFTSSKGYPPGAATSHLPSTQGSRHHPPQPPVHSDFQLLSVSSATAQLDSPPLTHSQCSHLRPHHWVALTLLGSEQPPDKPPEHSSHPPTSSACACHTPARHKCVLSLVSSG